MSTRAPERNVRFGDYVEPPSFRRVSSAFALLAVLAACGQGTSDSSPTTTAPVRSEHDANEPTNAYDASCLADCPQSMPARLEPACPALVANWQTTGNCQAWCESPGLPLACTQVTLVEDVPGTCHVDITFMSGLAYSTDVTFVRQAQDASCPCDSVRPTQAVFPIDDLDAGCLAVTAEAGPDATVNGEAGGAGADAGSGSDAGVEAGGSADEGSADGRIEPGQDG